MNSHVDLRPVTINGVTLQPRSPLHRVKLEALRTFLQQLQGRPAHNSIARVVLFGSTVNGDVWEESDVDLLVFGLGDLEAIRVACADVAFETGLQTGQSIQPLVYSLGHYYHPSSYFMQRSAREGKEVFSMDDRDLKLALLEGKRRLAMSYLRVARYVLSNRDYREAVDLGYNAAETLAKVLLLLEMDELPRSHGGVVNRFGDLYVRSGKVSSELGRGINLALEARGRARYDEDALITEDDAREMIILAERLLEYVERIIQDLTT